MSPSTREDGTTDPLPRSPGPRALDAMEHAARRAREATGAPYGSTPPHGVDEATALHDTLRPEGGPKRRPTRRIPVDRWLFAAVAVAAMLVIGGAGGLAVALAQGSGPGQVAAPPNRTPANLHASRPAHAKAHATGPATSQRSTTTTTTTMAPVVITGTAPVITSLNPSTGNIGQTLQISGGNFESANGQIVASFAGTAASTDCPTQSTCTVTVPTGIPAGTVPVTITTAEGVSNTVTFTFG